MQTTPTPFLARCDPSLRTASDATLPITTRHSILSSPPSTVSPAVENAAVTIERLRAELEAERAEKIAAKAELAKLSKDSASEQAQPKNAVDDLMDTVKQQAAERKRKIERVREEMERKAASRQQVPLGESLEKIARGMEAQRKLQESVLRARQNAGLATAPGGKVSQDDGTIAAATGATSAPPGLASGTRLLRLEENARLEDEEDNESTTSSVDEDQENWNLPDEE